MIMNAQMIPRQTRVSKKSWTDAQHTVDVGVNTPLAHPTSECSGAVCFGSKEPLSLSISKKALIPPMQNCHNDITNHEWHRQSCSVCVYVCM